MSWAFGPKKKKKKLTSPFKLGMLSKVWVIRFTQIISQESANTSRAKNERVCVWSKCTPQLLQLSDVNTFFSTSVRSPDLQQGGYDKHREGCLYSSLIECAIHYVSMVFLPQIWFYTTKRQRWSESPNWIITISHLWNPICNWPDDPIITDILIWYWFGPVTKQNEVFYTPIHFFFF